MNDSFCGSIADICGVELKTLVGSYKYSVFGSGTFVLEGHNGILSFSSECVRFAVKNGVVAVCGSELKIKCLQSKFAVICGVVAKVEVTN